MVHQSHCAGSCFAYRVEPEYNTVLMDIIQMDIIQLITLAVVQGLTEFLPISSSAHLILVPAFTGWKDQGLAFDVAVHVGTLAAVVVYFRNEVLAMARAWVASLQTHRLDTDARLAWSVVFATVPVGLAGFLYQDEIERYLRSPSVIATTTIAFGLLLGWADHSARRQRNEYSLNWRDVLVIGIAQALALIPGTSRSGITITAGLALGLTASAAARFSFLLSIPAIFLAGGLATLELLNQGSSIQQWQALLWATVIAAFSAYFSIHFFLKLLTRIGMLPFVAYRVLLGIGILLVFN